jgi:TRAP-type C4-dicarboxylate transport system substrate-binding protein
MKLAFLMALKAKRTWDRLPPEQRARILEGAKTTVKTHGPVVAKKAADTARTQGPVLAKRVGDALEKARRGLR